MNAKTKLFSPYALALQFAALRAELEGFEGLAATFRAMLEKEVRT